MYNTKVFVNQSMEIYPRGHHYPFLNSSGDIIVPALQKKPLVLVKLIVSFRF
jgi:hypothetical protein